MNFFFFLKLNQPTDLELYEHSVPPVFGSGILVIDPQEL